MGNLGYQELLLLLIVLCQFLIPLIFFLVSIQNVLKIIEPRNRTMKPGNVWLMLIPVFNIVWVFMVVNAIANSTKAQLEQYGVFGTEKPTYRIGLAWAICSVCSWVPLFGILTGLASLVLLIIYWIEVNNVKKQLLMLSQLHHNNGEGSIL